MCLSVLSSSTITAIHQGLLTYVFSESYGLARSLNADTGKPKRESESDRRWSHICDRILSKETSRGWKKKPETSHTIDENLPIHPSKIKIQWTPNRHIKMDTASGL